MERNAKVLFEPFDLSGLALNNRIVMAPLTRCRATPGTDAPHALNATYYRQRASAGLIISEATQISAVGKGYAWTPGIYSEAQCKGWQAVTDAVHQQHGLIFAQLWHVGRVSHASMQPGGAQPLAPSAIAAPKMKIFSEEKGFIPVDTPRAMIYEEIQSTIQDYRHAAQLAMRAGFDGVEIHAANGYLIHQFMSACANHRQDSYGGSLDNRLRFALEVVEAVTNIIDASRVGIRLSPVSSKGGVKEPKPVPLYTALIKYLNQAKLAYVHMIEGDTGGARELKGLDFHHLRDHFDGAWMVNNGYTRQMAIEAIASGYADLVAFGKPYIANPDLVARFQADAPLNTPIQSSFYGGGAQGYTDYPSLS